IDSGAAIHTVYIPIGGGGLAAGVAAVLKRADRRFRVVGVEAEGQACMTAAFQAGRPVPLSAVDPFCDATAVRMAGRLPFLLCRDLLDDLVIMSRRDVCLTIEYIWTAARVLAEPAGALAVAALLHHTPRNRMSGAAAILTGANVDFRRLAAIANDAR